MSAMAEIMPKPNCQLQYQNHLRTIDSGEEIAKLFNQSEVENAVKVPRLASLMIIE